jgi:hypothetical protein
MISNIKTIQGGYRIEIKDGDKVTTSDFFGITYQEANKRMKVIVKQHIDMKKNFEYNPYRNAGKRIDVPPSHLLNKKRKSL